MRKHITTLGLAAIALSGCTQSFFGGIHPQSHYVDPKATITPQGRVHGEASKAFFFSPNGIDSATKDEAFKKAMAQKPGSTVVINYAQVTKNFSFLFFGTETFEIEGQAAKVEFSPETSRDE